MDKKLTMLAVVPQINNYSGLDGSELNINEYTAYFFSSEKRMVYPLVISSATVQAIINAEQLFRHDCRYTGIEINMGMEITIKEELLDLRGIAISKELLEKSLY